jgi:sorbitol-specific phosphotransferase system component IIA
MAMLLTGILCIPAFSQTPKVEYKVKVKASGEFVQAFVGDHLDITFDGGSIKIVNKSSCSKKRDELTGDCPMGSSAVIAAQFPATAITQFTEGQLSKFVGIVWTVDDKRAKLIVDSSEKDLRKLVESLEEATGKQVINADSRPIKRPRVILGSESIGNTLAAYRNQSMEMAKDFSNQCPIVQVTINRQAADFTLDLNHIEKGLLIRDNQIELYNKDGDLIVGNEGGSISDGVKGACAVVTTFWAATLP